MLVRNFKFCFPETAMGVPIHAQEDPDSEYCRSVTDLAELTVHRRERIWLHPDFIFYNTPVGRRYKKCLNLVQGFTKKVIQERKALLSNAAKRSHESSDEDRSFGIRRKKAFLDLLQEVSMKEGTLTDEDIREEVDTFMIAGHDTTASSSSWTLFMLGHHPEVQEKVYAELSEIFQGSQRSPTMKDLNEMKYLERVIKESLRLYPTVPFIQRILKEDINIEGYDIPAGTAVTVLIYYANRNPEYFPNPEEFNPDNFLPERVLSRHNFAFVPFSAGPRNCIGQKFAMLEEKTILSSILRRFKIRSLERREDVNPIPAIVLRPEHGIKVALASRT
ncbi:hypothetical protein PR048_026597 [Dryococelus australis]|uniref:Cytochrome P450 n=1 Tax=Dryococelus australis TaxID=614101 RepID=A0ABQ9GLT3_9NEOP|nr:hypothetical protein PR048_026597 [Dryococelus australis]